MAKPVVMKGDIVLIYRKQYRGPFRYLVTRAILFFTTAWWEREKTSKFYHAEMAVGMNEDRSFRVATMEPPKYRYKDRRYDRKIIFRLMEKPEKFERYFDLYVKANLGKRYDFLRLFMMILNWVSRTTWFTDHYSNKAVDICSEGVARFFDVIGEPCSRETPNSTAPDDIYDFCLERPDRFVVVYDDKWSSFYEGN